MFFTFNAHADIAIDKPAPAFELFDQDNKVRQLSDYRGQWLILYFYPKDDTPGCTKEACCFRDDIDTLREFNAEIIGVSTDSIASHAKFVKKYKLSFPLLVDKDATLASAYGAAWKLGPVKICKRHSFVISPAGKIAKIYRKVKPGKHSNELITELKLLQSKNECFN